MVFQSITVAQKCSLRMGPENRYKLSCITKTMTLSLQKLWDEEHR